MFQNWGFLLAEMWFLLALASLLGVTAGWLIFGPAEPSGETRSEEVNALIADLDRSRAMHSDKDDRIRALGAEIDALRASAAPAELRTATSSEPDLLTAPRAEGPDDLTRIRGVGPKLAEACNELGVYHLDQIASWTEAEMAWIEDRLDRVNGRVIRDAWVAQARDLLKAKAA
ncbi:MAG: hypothetical protein AAFQ54_09255 [Pseudomonadota bacterium]